MGRARGNRRRDGLQSVLVPAFQHGDDDAEGTVRLGTIGERRSFERGEARLQILDLTLRFFRFSL